VILPGTYHNGFAPRDGEPLFPELWRGCVGAWNPGLGPTGLRIYDWSPYKNHGTLTNMDGGADWVASQGRYALDFDGVDDYVNLGAWQPISTTLPFTFTAWVRSPEISGFLYPNIATFRTNSGRFGFAFSSDAGGYLGMLFGSQDATWGRWRNGLAASVWTNTWRHVAYSYDGISPTTASSFQSYFDGNSVAITTASAFGAQADRSAIGSDSDSGVVTRMRGLLSDLRLHNRVLSPNEIRLLASRRGIAYEMIPSQLAGSEALIAAYRARQYSQIIGGGVI
jgi:hypothetical protein